MTEIIDHDKCRHCIFYGVNWDKPHHHGCQTKECRKGNKRMVES